MVVYITMWKSGLWKLKREALEEGPQKPQKEQGYTDSGTVASSINVLLFASLYELGNTT